jgi:hypothetical protein
MAAIVLPKKRVAQPLRSTGLDLSFPALSGVSASIITFGNAEGWLNNAAIPHLGSTIGYPTLNGTLASGTTDAGNALVFDGTSTYVDYGTANIPTVEFTLLWGGVFDANDSPRGFIDCTNNGVSGWNIYQGGGSTMYFNNSSYPAGNPSTGWVAGQFFHGALRNKGGVSCDWFRDGAKIYTGTGVSPTAPTLPLWIGRLKVGGLPYLKARFSYLYLLDKYLDDELIARIAINPYVIFAPQRYVFAFGDGATGPTNYTQSVGGILTPSGSLAKQTAKIFLGSATAAGSLFKQTAKNYSGSTTPAGAITKQAGKALAGSSTATGAIAKQTSKPLAGSSTAAGALNKQTTKSFAGSSTPTGAASTMILFTAAIAGSITVAGALSRMTLKALTGSSTLTGAISKMTSKGLSASITLDGALNRLTKKAFAGSVTAVGDLFETYQVLKSLAGSIKPTGAVTALYIAFVAGVLKLLTMMGVGQ